MSDLTHSLSNLHHDTGFIFILRRRYRLKKGKIIIFITIAVLSTIIIYGFIGTEYSKKYAYEELNMMLKSEFDTLIDGVARRSHFIYFRFAKEVQRVYNSLVVQRR